MAASKTTQVGLFRLLNGQWLLHQPDWDEDFAQGRYLQRVKAKQVEETWMSGQEIYKQNNHSLTAPAEANLTVRKTLVVQMA